MPEKLPDLFKAIIAASRKSDTKKAEAGLWKRFGTRCAMLVLDSTGFTRSTRKKGIIHFLRLFLNMQKLVVPVFKRHRCLAWRGSADNLFAEFATPDEAFAAAIDAQRAVKKAGLRLDARTPYRICIGIGYGEVLDAGDQGVFGSEMNLACKLGEDTAGGGETLLSENAYKHLSDSKGPSFKKKHTIQSGNKIAYYQAR